MNTMVDHFARESSVDSVKTVVIPEETSPTITTTLYDLIAAIQTAVEPDEEMLVVPTVMHLLRAGRITFLRKS